MKRCSHWPIGVCSWSLGTGVAEVGRGMRQLGLSHVHLALGPAMEGQDPGYVSAVQAEDWAITATMIGFPQEDYSTLVTIRRTGGIAPDECWERNRRIFLEAVEVTARLGVKSLSMHLGFINHRDEAYTRKMRERTVYLADRAADQGIILLLETGQETAADLRIFLESLNHPALAVNLDPANMILYGKGDPVAAVEVLSPWIRHVHIKDALQTLLPGTWGTEVRWAEGQVHDKAFLDALKRNGFEGTLAIERESGDSRIEDIQVAVEKLAVYGG
jgi:L-ribulose-5-phosphate 3-epimerase